MPAATHPGGNARGVVDIDARHVVADHQRVAGCSGMRCDLIESSVVTG